MGTGFGANPMLEPKDQRGGYNSIRTAHRSEAPPSGGLGGEFLGLFNGLVD